MFKVKILVWGLLWFPRFPLPNVLIAFRAFISVDSISWFSWFLSGVFSISLNFAMSFSSLIVSIGLLVVLILYLAFRWRSKHIRDLTDGMPGIKTLPWRALIEHFMAKDKSCNYSEYQEHFFHHCNRLNVTLALTDLYNVLEKIIAPFPDLSKGWLGPFCMIDLRKPEYIKKVLNSEKCIDRASFYSFPYKTGLLISGGEMWKRHRKILNPVFSTNKLNKFMPIVNEKARKLGEAINAHINKGEFNVVRLLSALTLENLLQSSFGLEKDFINNPFDKFFAIVKKFERVRFEFPVKLFNFVSISEKHRTLAPTSRTWFTSSFPKFIRKTNFRCFVSKFWRKLRRKAILATTETISILWRHCWPTRTFWLMTRFRMKSARWSWR